MWFLIKGAFWFGLVLVLLPIFDREATSNLQSAPGVEWTDALSAASGVYEYVSAICTEKPDVCVKGSETVTALGHRAREGARIAYEFLDGQFGGAETSSEMQADEAQAAAPRREQGDHLPFIDEEEVITGTIAPLPARKPQHG